MVLLDFKGFGLSGGIRIADPSMVAHHRDIGLALSKLDPALPTFVFGHSMGGFNVATFLMQNPNLNIAGAMLSAPMFDQLQENFPNWKRVLLPILAPIFEVSLSFLNA